MDLPIGSRWRVCAKLEGWWAPCSVLTVEVGDGALAQGLDLWPTGWLAGRLRFPETGAPRDSKNEPPAAVEVSFRSPHPVGRAAAVPRSSRECPLAADGTWRCELPAEVLDVAVRVPGFVVERLWGVEVPRGGRRDVGARELRRGASVAAWVQLADGEGEPSGCSARLFPFVPGGAKAAAAERAARAVAEAAVLDNGFLQLGPVAAGTYVLEVAHPGYAPARVFPLELWAEDETSLRDPIVLRLPLTVEVEIRPPTDWRRLPWQVSLERSADLGGSFAGSPAYHGAAGANGRVVVEGQAPGTYRLVVRDSVGDPFYARQDLVIEGAGDARIEVDVELITLHGEIALGDEPVLGTLWFGGRYGASRVELQSDLDGRFAGVLPRAGWWRLEIEASELGVEVETRVEVKPDADGDALLEIELPDTQLFGRVVGEEGRGFAGATVWLHDSVGGVRKRTDETGAFEFRAFEPGAIGVRASAASSVGSLTAAPVSVPVVESVPFGPVELRLIRTRTLRGRVVSAEGTPVGGALVDLATLWPPSAAHADSVRADPDGSFQVEVHPAAESLQAVVSPPGYAFQVLTLAPDDPLVLTVSREHGTLVLDRGSEPPEERRSPLWLVLLADGNVLPHQRLHEWARGHGRVWRVDGQTAEIPRLAPGVYRGCLVHGDEMAAAQSNQGSWQAALERCAEGYLAPGATLTLRLPTATEH